MNLPYVIESNYKRFNIIRNSREIKYIDEDGATLTWVNNEYNQYLVECMVEELIGTRIRL